jgi:hypothetical protein
MMFEKAKGFVAYAAKAVVAAVGPVLVALFDSIAVELGSIVQTAASALVAAVLVYFTRNTETV